MSKKKTENPDSPWTMKIEQQEFTKHLLESTIKGYNLALDEVLKICKEYEYYEFPLLIKKIEGLRK